jgi:hypothetical protein
MSFSSVLHRSELLSATSEVREQLCLLYTDLLSLVVNVGIRFYKTVNGKLYHQRMIMPNANMLRYDFRLCEPGHLRAFR